MPRKGRGRTVEGGAVPDIVTHEHDAVIIEVVACFPARDRSAPDTLTPLT
jgi:hypothetical protein